jgi:hypothetical protein
MDLGFVIGIAPETVKKHEFIVIPTTHLHIGMVAEQDLTLEQRAELYVKRLQTLLDSDLPDGKVGFAHPTTCLIAILAWRQRAEKAAATSPLLTLAHTSKRTVYQRRNSLAERNFPNA